MEWMTAAGLGVDHYWRALAWVLPVMTLLEMTFPAREQPLKQRLRPALFWALSVPVTGAVMGLSDHLRSVLGLHPLVTLQLWFGWNGPTRMLSLVLAPLAAAVVADFFFYWMHRVQHRFFWNFHRVHHAAREMNAVASYHHISEELFHTALMVAPMALLVSPDAGPIVPFMAVFTALRGYYSHSNLRFHVGPVLRRLFCDNRFHRIHHSIEPRHFNLNFCSVCPLWDVLFGTAYFPARDEWPDTGVADFPEPTNIREWLLAPLAQSAGETPRAVGDRRAAAVN